VRDFGQIDFLVLAPLDLEVEALREVFGEDSNQPHRPSEFYDYEVKGKDEKLYVRVLQLPRAGVLRSGVRATELLIQWKPRYIVSFGIAGGFTESGDVKLRDVIVGDYVFYYEPAKEARALNRRRGKRRRKMVGPQSRQARPDPIHTAEEFPLYVQRSLRNNTTLLGGYRIRTGYLASGEKLIDDPDSSSREAIKAINGKILGCEQEAAGIGAACQWTDILPKPGFLVVKGVSDNARHKGALNKCRKPAALNAAIVLLKLLQETKLYVRRDASLPEYLERVLELSKRIEMTLAPYLAEPLDHQSLSNALHSLEDLPPVFYHWETRHDHIHWVDFHHLLLLRKLMDLDLIPHILLTEFRDSASTEDRLNIEKTIRSVLRDDVSITWYSELSPLKLQYTEYAQSLGFDDAVRAHLRSANHALGLRGNIITEEWLQFMIWTVRETRRCLILKWQRHAALVGVLKKLNLMQVATIFTPDLMIGDALGKFDPSNSGLVIDPPKYEAILGWLSSEPAPLHVRELARHLSLGEVKGEALNKEAIALVAENTRLQRQLTDSGAEVEPALRGLLNTLGTWNRRYFGVGQ